MTLRVARDGAGAGAAPASAGAGEPEYVALAGVTKTYRRDGRETHALDAIDLSIRAGEFLAIVGPSGCGKSTLLRIVAGLHLGTSGETRVAGRIVDRPQTDLGIVFQSPVLLAWRTAIDNVLVQVELRGHDPRAYRDRAQKLLEQVGLGDFADRFPHELSGGMRQRVAIARALIHDAPLLLMDEPFGALDALTREQMRLDLEALWLATRKTVLFITHSIDEAVLLADRVVVMSPRPGRVERVFTPGLPRPRGLEARRAREFVDTTEAITDIFLARGVLHGAGRAGGAT
ncbi:sulfonate transport system ATP-binding protein [Burkholderiales bacterium]|nr:sulfonate transport system ATP-binding protein [Burkholderiales bacterium]